MFITRNNSANNADRPSVGVTVIGQSFGGIHIDGLGFLSTVSAKRRARNGGSFFENIIQVVSKREIKHGEYVIVIGNMRSKIIDMPFTYNTEDGKVIKATDEEGNVVTKEGFRLNYVDGIVTVADEEIPQTRHSTQCAGSIIAKGEAKPYHNSKSRVIMGKSLDDVPAWIHIMRREHRLNIEDSPRSYIIGHLESDPGPAETLEGWVGDNNERAIVQPLFHRIVIDRIMYGNNNARSNSDNNVATDDILIGDPSDVLSASNSGVVGEFSVDEI